MYKTIASLNGDVKIYDGKLGYENLFKLTGEMPKNIEHIEVLHNDSDFGDFYSWSNKIVENNFGSNFKEGFPIVNFSKDGSEVEVITAYGELENGVSVLFDKDNLEWGVEFAEGGLLAPNGKQSNLTPEQYKLVRTPQFKAFFGDWEKDPSNSSKVVDENGEPLVVYHGTYVKEQFNIFDFEKADLGFHFGTYEQAKERSQTKMYVEGFKSIIKPYFLNIRTLVNVTDIGDWEYPQRYIDMLVSDNLITEKEAKQNGFYDIFYREDNKLVREFLIHKFGNIGFDYENKIESKGLSYLVLQPNQIKLADGTNTTFDMNNPYIRFAKGGEIDWTSKKSINIKINNDLYKVQYQQGERGDTDKKVWFANVISKNNEEIEGRLCFENSMSAWIYGFSLKEVESWIWDSYINNELYLIIEDDYGNEKEIIHIEVSEKSKYESGGSLDCGCNHTMEGGGEIGNPNENFIKWFVGWYKSEVYKVMNITISIPVLDYDFGIKAKQNEIVILDWFEKIDQNINANQYLKKICEKADEYGVYIIAEPVTTENIIKSNPRDLLIKTTKEFLKKYYKSFGFESFEGKDFMVRKPLHTMEQGGEINHEETYKKWKSLVNMSKSELENFYNSEEGKEAGLSSSKANELGIHSGRESARWIIKMKDTPHKEWTPKMWEWANRQISFISRMSGNKGGLYDDKGNKTRKHTSLLIWGHNPKKYESGGSVGVGVDVKYIDKDKAKQIIEDFTHYKSGDKFYPKTKWANWFMSQNRNAKELIAKEIRDNKDFKNALLSNWYDNYKKETNDNITFQEFLNKDIEIYRGKTSRDLKYGEPYGFDSYTTDKALAEHFARDGDGEIVSKKIKPKDTYGLITSIGNEKEVIIPTKYSKEFLKKEWDDFSNKNMKVFDNISDKDNKELDSLLDKEDYQGAIDKVQSIINDIIYAKGGTISQTPAPKEDKVYGSKVNAKGSSKDTESAKEIKFDAKTLLSINEKVREHNKQHPNKKITLASAKAVVRRGMGAYSSTHRPTISGGKPNSRVAWGLARLNAFMYKIIHGKSKSGKYKQDDDLINELGYSVKSYEDGGSVPKSMQSLLKEIDKYKTAKEFADAHIQEDLMDLSNAQQHRFGRIFTDYGEGIQDVVAINKAYRKDLDYEKKANVPRVIDPLQKVTIYRMAHKEATGIEVGDYVSFSKDYVISHKDSLRFKGKLLKMEVPAKDVIWQGNDFNEWIYSPKEIRDKYSDLKDFYNKQKSKGDANYERGGSLELIAPNGKPSNLTPEQYKLVRTPAFKQWFGDWENDPANASKVVDKNGEPLVVYHVTNIYFTIFDKKKSKDGFFFSAQKERLTAYNKSRILSIFLNIKNPSPNEFETKGFDGIMDFGNRKVKDVSALYEIVAFEPNQIKLADGTNTTFDAENNDIRYEKGGIFNDKELLAKWKKGESIGFTAIAHLKAKGLIPRADGTKRKSEKYMDNGGLIEQLRAEEQAEYHNMSNPKDEIKRKEIYDKYDKLITPLMRQLAPNGNLSNLTPEQYKLVRTPQFKAWFGDWEKLAYAKINDSGIDEVTLENLSKDVSKVVDENGEPLVVWHYSKRLQYELDKFYTFRVDKQIGSHFGTLKQAQNLKYIPTGESEVKTSNKELSDFRYYQVFLNIKKPIRLKDVGIFDANTLTDSIEKEIKTYDWEYINNYTRKSKDSLLDRVKYILKSKFGYDGAIYLNRYESDAESSFINSLDDVSDKVFKNKVPSAEDSYIAFYPNQIKLADGTNTTFDADNPDIRYESGGGLFKPHKSIEQIAVEKNVPLQYANKQLQKGIEVESEHSDSLNVQKTIALQHLDEMIDYYDKLEIMEKKYKDGGVVVGKRHSESDENGTGEKFLVKSTGQVVELEGGEGVLSAQSMQSDKMFTFNGKRMSGREVASFLNHKYGGVEFAKGGEVGHVCGCKQYYHGGELPTAIVDELEGGEAVITVKTMESKNKYNFNGSQLTPRQILSQINVESGGKKFEEGGILDLKKYKLEITHKLAKMVYFAEKLLHLK